MNEARFTRELAASYVKYLENSKPMSDSLRRHYAKNYAEDGTYIISVTDPVLKRYLGEVHPESFIDFAIEQLNR